MSSFPLHLAGFPSKYNLPPPPPPALAWQRNRGGRGVTSADGDGSCWVLGWGEGSSEERKESLCRAGPSGLGEVGGSDALTSQLVILLGKDHSLYQEGLSDKESDSQEVREQATEMDL